MGKICPDCKIEMEEINMGWNKIPLEIPYYKCPRCKIEIEEEE